MLEPLDEREFEKIQDVYIDGEINYKCLIDHGLITEDHKGLFLVIDNTIGQYCFGRNQDEAMKTAMEHDFVGVLYGKQL